MMLKRAKDLYLARPEGPESYLPGEKSCWWGCLEQANIDARTLRPV